MNKQELTRSIESRYGSFVNVSETAEFLKVDRGTARALLYGLSFIQIGRSKRYYASDVAQRLTERKQT